MFAQNQDSLELVFKNSKNNPDLQMKIYDDLCNTYLTKEPAKSKFYALAGLEIAENSNNQELKARLLRDLGTSYSMAGSYDSAAIYLLKAKEISSGLEKKDVDALVNLSLGSLFTRQKKYGEAMNMLLMARNYFESNGDKKNLRKVLGNIAALFMYQHNFTQAEKYYLASEVISSEIKDYSGLGQVYSGLSNIYLRRGFVEKALELAILSANAFHMSGEKAYESVAYKEIAHFYLELNNYTMAEENGKKSFAIATEAGISRYISNALSILAEIYFIQRKYELSIEKSLESLNLDSTDTETKKTLFANLMKCYTSIGNTEQAVSYFERYNKEIDGQVNENYLNSISEMEVRYETEKKELAIQTLQAKKRVNTFAGLSVILLMLIIVGILIFRQKNILSKKKIADQKIRHLKRQKQLIATKALLEGEETERIRIAAEIHDGLGGLLTSAKLKLAFLKDSGFSSEEQSGLVDNTLHLIDKSIAEMRKVAHNLMPETLRHYGLKTALNDFIYEIIPEDLPKITINNFGDDLRYNKEVEITIYRIVQELVNNALKYAQASQIDIQLFLEPNRVCLQVIDNGIGFDAKHLSHSKKGKGIENINHRITAFNGRFEILSEPGKGTECTVEFLMP